MESDTGRAFLGFTEKDRQNLLEAYLFIRADIPPALVELYSTLDAIDRGPKNFGLNPDTLRIERIEHWRHLFTGTFGREYENAARRLAIQAYEAGVPSDLLTLTFMKMMAVFHRSVREAKGLSPERACEITDSITKAVSVDVALALSPYSGDLI